MITQYYRTLGLEPGSTLAQIKRAYKALAKKHHPDKRRNIDLYDPEIDFPKIQEAYEALKKHFHTEEVRKNSRTSLKRSIAKRLTSLTDQLDSGSDSSEQDYLMQQILQVHSLKEKAESFAHEKVKTQKQQGQATLQKFQQLIRSTLQKDSDSSDTNPIDLYPSQQTLHMMMIHKQDIFKVSIGKR